MAGPVQARPTIDLTIIGTHDNNISFGRSSQFLSPPTEDDIGLVRGQAAWTYHPLKGSLTLQPGLLFAVHRRSGGRDLREYDLNATGEWFLGNWSLRPEVQVRRHEERLSVWDFWDFLAGGSANWQTPVGILMDFSYVTRWQNFTSQSARNSYANVDLFYNRLGVEAKLWHSANWRSGFGYNFDYAWYAGNTSPSLYEYSGLGPGADRKDFAHVLRASELFKPFKSIVITAEAQRRDQHSNSRAFRYVGWRWAVGIYAEVTSSTVVFAEGGFQTFDYFQARFDSRYLNTRYDEQFDFVLSVRRQLTPILEAEWAVRTVDHDSNDALDFRLGASKSFSAYAQTVSYLRLHVRW